MNARLPASHAMAALHCSDERLGISSSPCAHCRSLRLRHYLDSLAFSRHGFVNSGDVSDKVDEEALACVQDKCSNFVPEKSGSSIDPRVHGRIRPKPFEGIQHCQYNY